VEERWVLALTPQSSLSFLLSPTLSLYVLNDIGGSQKYLFEEDLGLRKGGLHDSALIIGFIHL